MTVLMRMKKNRMRMGPQMHSKGVRGLKRVNFKNCFFLKMASLKKEKKVPKISTLVYRHFAPKNLFVQSERV